MIYWIMIWIQQNNRWPLTCYPAVQGKIGSWYQENHNKGRQDIWHSKYGNKMEASLNLSLKVKDISQHWLGLTRCAAQSLCWPLCCYVPFLHVYCTPPLTWLPSMLPQAFLSPFSPSSSLSPPCLSCPPPHGCSVQCIDVSRGGERPERMKLYPC